MTGALSTSCCCVDLCFLSFPFLLGKPKKKSGKTDRLMKTTKTESQNTPTFKPNCMQKKKRVRRQHGWKGAVPDHFNWQ